MSSLRKEIKSSRYRILLDMYNSFIYNISYLVKVVDFNNSYVNGAHTHIRIYWYLCSYGKYIRRLKSNNWLDKVLLLRNFSYSFHEKYSYQLKFFVHTDAVLVFLFCYKRKFSIFHVIICKSTFFWIKFHWFYCRISSSRSHV